MSESDIPNEPLVLITSADLAARLHVSAGHLKKLEEAGLPVYKLSAQVRRYDWRAVQAWLAARLREGEST